MYLDEDAEILERLFSMVCGLPFHDIESHDLLESLLFAAEKYDMPGPMSILRMSLLTPALDSDPIRLYSSATRYNWKREGSILSNRTLPLNIHDKKHQNALRTLSTDALLDLITLHRDRREG